jgi:hypothetical protein
MRDSVSALLALAASLSAALLALLLVPASAGAQRSPLAEGEPCPSTMYTDRDELLCHCGKTEGQEDVWGTDVYTDDSELCHAAKHAGIIGEAGGSIHVRRAPGQSSYRGSTRNGFTSGNYGAWEGSIVFADAATLTGGVPLCPSLYTANVGFSGNCYCDKGSLGQVWGSNPYNAGSSVCGAALHAGVIGRNGGTVNVTPAGPQQRFTASDRNGVYAQADSANEVSFRISAP